MSNWFYNSFEDRSALNSTLLDTLLKNTCNLTSKTSAFTQSSAKRTNTPSEKYTPSSVILRSSPRFNKKRTLTHYSDSPIKVRSALKKQKILNIDNSLYDSPIQYIAIKKAGTATSKSYHKRSNISYKNGAISHEQMENLLNIEEADLAIHPKKIEELMKWLRARMLIERGNKTLLLSGPCGCGKTAAVKAICLELGIEILEFDGNQEYELNYKGDEIWEKSAMEVFTQFLRNSQFGSIEKMSLKHRLLLIEPLPNMFYRKPQLLSEILNKYVRNSRCIIVFIMSNIDSCWELNPVRLFSDAILEEFKITHIKFNSVATAFMNKAVKRAFQIFAIKSIESGIIKEIVASANGDIRKALNIIEFRINGKKKNSTGTTAALKLKLLTNPIYEHYDIFKYLGKIMYAKRLDTENLKWTNLERILLPKARKKFARPFPPKENLSELAAANPISGSLLIAYIFEHETNFAPSISALASAVTNISIFDSDFQTNNMDSNYIIEKYLLEISIRSTIFHNYSQEPRILNRRGLYQFSKPSFKAIEEKRNAERQKMILQCPEARRNKDFFYMQF